MQFLSTPVIVYDATNRFQQRRKPLIQTMMLTTDVI